MWDWVKLKTWKKSLSFLIWGCKQWRFPCCWDWNRNDSSWVGSFPFSFLQMFMTWQFAWKKTADWNTWKTIVKQWSEATVHPGTACQVSTLRRSSPTSSSCVASWVSSAGPCDAGACALPLRWAQVRSPRCRRRTGEAQERHRLRSYEATRVTRKRQCLYRPENYITLYNAERNGRNADWKSLRAGEAKTTYALHAQITCWDPFHTFCRRG